MPVPVAAQKQPAQRRKGPRRYASPMYSGSLAFDSEGLTAVEPQVQRPQGLRTTSLQQQSRADMLHAYSPRTPGYSRPEDRPPAGSPVRRDKFGESRNILRLGEEWATEEVRNKRAVAGRTGNLTSHQRDEHWGHLAKATPRRASRRKCMSAEQQLERDRNRASTTRSAHPSRYVDSVRTLHNEFLSDHRRQSAPNEEIVVKHSTHATIWGGSQTAAVSPSHGRFASPVRSLGGSVGRRRCLDATGALNTSGGNRPDRSRGVRRVDTPPDNNFITQQQSAWYGPAERGRGLARGNCAPERRSLSARSRDLLTYDGGRSEPEVISSLGQPFHTRRRAGSASAERGSHFSAGFSHWEAADPPGSTPTSPGRPGLRRCAGGEPFQPYLPPDLCQRLVSRQKNQPWLHSSRTAEGMQHGYPELSTSRADRYAMTGSPSAGRARSASAPRCGDDIKSFADFVSGR